jgi:hypothetical protein
VAVDADAPLLDVEEAHEEGEPHEEGAL